MRFRLKDFRESKKMFQSELASILQVNQSSISRSELRSTANLTYPQYQTLCEKFGEEEVRQFIESGEGDNTSIIIRGNKNEGGGIQANGFIADATAMDVIKEQATALREVAKKQAEQTDRLLSILEKMADK